MIRQRQGYLWIVAVLVMFIVAVSLLIVMAFSSIKTNVFEASVEQKQQLDQALVQPSPPEYNDAMTRLFFVALVILILLLLPSVRKRIDALDSRVRKKN